MAMWGLMVGDCSSASTRSSHERLVSLAAPSSALGMSSPGSMSAGEGNLPQTDPRKAPARRSTEVVLPSRTWPEDRPFPAESHHTLGHLAPTFLERASL